MAIPYDRYNRLTHDRMRQTVAHLSERMRGMELIEPTLSGEETEHFRPIMRKLRNELKDAQATLDSMDRHVVRTRVQTALFERAHAAAQELLITE